MTCFSSAARWALPLKPALSAHWAQEGRRLPVAGDGWAGWAASWALTPPPCRHRDGVIGNQAVLHAALCRVDHGPRFSLDGFCDRHGKRVGVIIMAASRVIDDRLAPGAGMTFEQLQLADEPRLVQE
jgi:hypothetical protein